MVLMYSLKVRIKIEKEKAKAFFSSIKPELEEEFARSTTSVLQSKEGLTFEVKATDRTAMRASLNSLMKPLILFTELSEID